MLPICPSVQATIGNVDIRDWDERYRLGDSDLAPTALVVETTRQAPPGSALDLACGAGRNALWLAEHGWSVTAVDGAPAAIDILLKRASERALRVEAFLAPDSSHNSARPEYHVMLGPADPAYVASNEWPTQWAESHPLHQ